MDILLILNDLRVNSLEFSLQHGVACSRSRAIGAATGLVGVEIVVLELGDALATPIKFISAFLCFMAWRRGRSAPIALPAALLLRVGRILASIARLGEVTREVLLWSGGARG
jgi:drug/metabolite transporter superfamily protein YnfA